MERVDNYFSFLQVPARPPKPRSTGITIVEDVTIGMRATKDVVEHSDELIDYMKIADHAALVARHSKDWLKGKVDYYHANNIKTKPGGVIFEVAVLQNKVELYMERVKDLGFDGVEISDDVLPPMSAKTRAGYIKTAQRFGLEPFTEVGRKDPTTPLKADELIAIIKSDLEAGAKFVTLENSDIAYSLKTGDFKPVEQIARDVGLDQITFEVGPNDWPGLARVLFKTFGPNINVENVLLETLRHVDALRRGMSRIDSFDFLVGRGGRIAA